MLKVLKSLRMKKILFIAAIALIVTACADRYESTSGNEQAGLSGKVRLDGSSLSLIHI